MALRYLSSEICRQEYVRSIEIHIRTLNIEHSPNSLVHDVLTT